jgi:cytochrome c biogenesis protein CcmG/thiol:disulfide interchange protein DsbE
MVTPASSRVDETKNHKIEFQCPNCGNPSEHAETRCPKCGMLGGGQYSRVRGRMPSFASTPEDASTINRHPGQSDEFYRTPLQESESSQLKDIAPKRWLRKADSITSEDTYEPGKNKHKIRTGWGPSPVVKSLRLIGVAALILIVAIGIFQLINSNVIQKAFSQISKIDVPKLEFPKTTGSKPSAILDMTSPVISNILISEINDTNAVITWTTDEPSSTQVEYGTSANYGKSSVFNEEMVTKHAVKLSALTPGTSYYFRIKSKDAAGNLATSTTDDKFVTIPPPDINPPVISNIKIADISDTAATITWTTDEKAIGQIEYGASVAYGTTAQEDSLVTNHSLTLGGLEAEKTYFFRVKSKDANKNESMSDATQPFKTIAPVPTGPDVGKRAPDFTVYTLDGASVTLSKLRGKIVLVNFWALGCGACMAEMPDIDAVYKTLSGSDKIKILAINAGDYPKFIESAVQQEKWTMPIYIDTDRVAGPAYQIRYIPRTFFVDSSGIIRKIQLGSFASAEEIKEAINALQ